MQGERGKILRGLDWTTILIYILLMLMGWLNIYAAVYSEEHSSIFDISQRYGAQMLWIVAALVIAFFIIIVDSRFFFVFAYIIYGVILISLLLVALFGVEVNATRAWFEVGAFRIQPSEFAKFATALALARYMSGHSFSITNLASLARVLIIILLPTSIILLQNDVGSSMVFGAFVFVLYREGLPHWVMLFLVFLVILFISELIFPRYLILIALFSITMVLFAVLENRYRDAFRFTIAMVGLGAVLYGVSEFFALEISTYYLFLIVILIGIPIVLVQAYIHKLRYVVALVLFFVVTVSFSFSVDFMFHNVLETHHRERINDMLGVDTDPLGWGYNVNQSKIAIGSGGFWGKGYLNGTQTKFNFVPEQSTDFIFCTIGEEWGFVGAFVLVFLFVLLLLRLITIAERQKEAFARIYGYGVVSILFFHAAVNISMTVGLFPVVGIPLPFFSYGGSSLWAYTILLFILLKFDSTRMD